MKMLGFLLIPFALQLSADSPSKAEVPAVNKRQQQLTKLHTEQAKAHVFKLKKGKTLKLQPKPIYVWTNPTRNSVQEGAVFVWTHLGRPEVIATIFSHPAGAGQRQVNHEFHSLCQSVFKHSHPRQTWAPKTGITTAAVPGAGVASSNPVRRKIEQRALAREFSAHSMNLDNENRTQLRLLPQPIMRYQPDGDEVLDGALFVFAAGVGTDPEVVLLIEARKHDKGYRWEYAVCRYSDMNLFVQHKKKEVWKSVRGGANAFKNDANHWYRLMFDGPQPFDAASQPQS